EYLPVEMTVDVNYNEVKEIKAILKKPALLSIFSTPDNIKFTLGEKYSGVTPATLTVEDGKYKLKCTEANYYPYEMDVILKEGEAREINIILQHQVGALEINSVPAGAEVTFDSAKVGFTPYKITDLNTGEYSLTLIKDDLLLDTAVTIYPDITNRYTFYLQRGYGSLEILTYPSGANVFIDDIEKGISPLLIENLLAGNHQIKAKKIGYSTKTTSINVRPKESITAYLNLEKQSLLNIDSHQDSVYVILDKNDLGFAPISVYLDSGQHFIDAYKNGYPSFRNDFYLQPGTDKKLTLNLQKKTSAPGELSVFEKRIKPRKEKILPQIAGIFYGIYLVSVLLLILTQSLP
ncbi:MAG: PEGA domain-containing protein, partial [Candidatus Omnitrophica bacterium]|nr:PEGA domain-containing protein [Candidatus Omnitrophota bacterium]